MTINKWFSEFHQNLYMDQNVVEKVQQRYKAITKRINIEYWGNESEYLNSLYVGSYGRGTSIYTSDIDILVVLPQEVKNRFDLRNGNIQSQLLQEVKVKLQKSYYSSDVSADGQVIVIGFSDGIKFEIVPVFEKIDGSYYYPDTNNGGVWKTTNPVKEKSVFNTRDSVHNKTMKKLCRMIRAWNTHCDVNLNGILIDSMVYEFYCTAKYIDENPFLYFDWISRDFFNFLYDNAHKRWYTPGTFNELLIEYPYSTKRKALEAYEKVCKAIEWENVLPLSAKDKWRDVYGKKFV